MTIRPVRTISRKGLVSRSGWSASWTVNAIDDLQLSIVPFFEEHPLLTAKAGDFVKFAHVVRMMRGRSHLTLAGLSQIARIAQTMNRQQPSRFLESSEAIRQSSRHDR